MCILQIKVHVLYYLPSYLLGNHIYCNWYHFVVWMLTSFIMQTTQLMYVVQSIYFLKHYAVLSVCLKQTHCSMNDWSGLTKLSFLDLGPNGLMSCSSRISIKSLILNWLFSLPRCLAIPHKSYYLYINGWLISNCPKTRSRISKRAVSLSHMSMSCLFYLLSDRGWGS